MLIYTSLSIESIRNIKKNLQQLEKIVLEENVKSLN